MSPSTSIRLMTDAVIAQYIHEISVRHRPRGGGQKTAAQAVSPAEVNSPRTTKRRQIRSGLRSGSVPVHGSSGEGRAASRALVRTATCEARSGMLARSDVISRRYRLPHAASGPTTGAEAVLWRLSTKRAPIMPDQPDVNG